MLRRISFLVAVVALCVGALMPGTALGQAPDEPPRDQVVLSGDVLVPRGRIVREVVVVHGSATVLGVVEGGVIVLDGPAVIAGQVGGDVVVLDGRLVLRETAQIAGNVLAGDEVQREDGAQVAGEVREGFRVSLEGPVAALGALLVSIAMTVSMLVVMVFLLVLAPRGVERLGVAMRTAPFASAGWGLVVTIVLPVAAVALAASVVGLPLGLAVLLALGLVFLVGLAAAGWGIGRVVVGHPRSRVGAMFAGWAIVAIVGLVPLLNAIAWGLASVFGLGLIVVAAWRARGTGKHRVGGAAPQAAAATPSP